MTQRRNRRNKKKNRDAIIILTYLFDFYANTGL